MQNIKTVISTGMIEYNLKCNISMPTSRKTHTDIRMVYRKNMGIIVKQILDMNKNAIGATLS